jgi:hypothetical protein
MKQGNMVMRFSGNVALTDGGNILVIVATHSRRRGKGYSLFVWKQSVGEAGGMPAVAMLELTAGKLDALYCGNI